MSASGIGKGVITALLSDPQKNDLWESVSSWLSRLMPSSDVSFRSTRLKASAVLATMMTSNIVPPFGFISGNVVAFGGDSQDLLHQIHEFHFDKARHHGKRVVETMGVRADAGVIVYLQEVDLSFRIDTIIHACVVHALRGKVRGPGVFPQLPCRL